MTSTRYFFGASHEEFSPEALLEQAVAAERAGFEGISASDHLQPWWEPGESGHTWVWLGAAGHATQRVPLGIGAGEALNEVPVGDEWPSPQDQIARMEQALSMIDRLWNGETITEHGPY